LGANVKARNPGRPLGGLKDGTEHAHRGRLASAIRTQEAEDFTCLRLEVDVIDRYDLATAQIAKGLGKVGNGNHGAQF
jgi:hypothetical protein